MANLEDVFRLSGVPTYTYVEPDRYNEIKVSIRAPGRCVVLEGPSGIGKTTIVTKVLEELNLADGVSFLRARNPQDVNEIRNLPRADKFGLVIIDDFHRLPDDVRGDLSDLMKLLADTEDQDRKLVLIGINKAGQQLVQHGRDLGLRLDIYRLEANSKEKIEHLISLGEEALRVILQDKESIAERSQGSFQVAQMLAHRICATGGVTETAESDETLPISVDGVLEDVLNDLGLQFKSPLIAFARGRKIRPEGRAPYLHILRWLSESDDGAVDLHEITNTHPEMKGSIVQVVEKGYLSGLLCDPENADEFNNLFHYDEKTGVIGIEDPKLLFYLKNLVWRAFTSQCGFVVEYFDSPYDFALSFAGAQRNLAEKIAAGLIERDIGVFYDFNEQHLLLGENVEEYLTKIYRSEASFVIPILSKEYPTRVWTKIESDAFRDRFGDGAVFPIRLADVSEGYFSDQGRYGGISLDPADAFDTQIEEIVDILSKRLTEERRKRAYRSK